MITTKWPRLLVVGEPVTEAQADEILIRTNGWQMLFSNDHGWLRTVERTAAEFGYPPDPDPKPGTGWDGAKFRARWDALTAWEGRMGILNLNYLHNDRIMSTWIGGPHGWCDWTGRIGTGVYNIGKWPSDEEVTEDWTAIAEAFPYLNLTAQCVEDEGEGQLAAQWRVVGGAVTYDPEPTEPIAPMAELSDGAILNTLFGGVGERGVSVDRLRQALQRVAEREHGKES